MTLTRKWALGTAVLTVLILVAGWLLLIAPTRSEAAQLGEAAAAQRSTNGTLQLRLEELEAKAVDLPELRARLATVRSRLPAGVELPALVRSLETAAEGAGMDLRGVVPAVPELVTAAPSVNSAPGAVAAPAPGGDQLYAVRVTVTLAGRFAGVSAFVNALEELTRSFQVTSFTISTDSAETTGPGGVSLTVQGRVYVLSATTPDVSVTTATDPLAAPVPTPVASTPAPTPVN